jgi:N-acetyl-alpha-D-glucosaminyl L-malate synthase BshA
MNIGIVCWPGFGGSGVIATELAIALAQKGHKVHLISWQVPVRLDKVYPNLFFHAVPLDTYSFFPYPFYTISLASTIYRVVNDYQLDIIHTHYAIPHTQAALFVKQICKVKVITTLHGTDIYLLGTDASYKKIIEYSINMSDGVTAVSQALINYTEKNFNLTKKIKLIYNFINPEKFKRIHNLNLRRFYAKDNEKIIMHISNFRETKNVLQVVDVFRDILSKLQAKLILVGEGPQLNLVKERVKQKNLSEKVYFLGSTNTSAELLSIADLFILTSTIESFGLVALEAMSCQVPVVAYRVGGLPEVIEDGKCGFLVNLNETSKLADCAIRLLKDKDLHSSFSYTARKIAESKFNQKNIVDEYERYYYSILKS